MEEADFEDQRFDRAQKACNSSRTHGGANLRLFQNFITGSALTAIKERLKVSANVVYTHRETIKLYA